MTVPHGKNTHFELDNSTGTLTDLSVYIDSIDFPQEVDEVETTTFGSNSKTYIVGLESSQINLGGPFDPTLDAHMTAVIDTHQTSTRSFEYGPQGDGTGRKYTGECYITSYHPDSKVGDAARWTATLRVTGDVTRGTY